LSLLRYNGLLIVGEQLNATKRINSENRIIFFIIELVSSSNVINVNLTNLWGLEIAELKEEVMPMV
jgi:hypothetical protein